MRTSEAGLALFKRLKEGGAVEYLTQWNENWQMFSLIGGHVEAGESFHQCCVREVAEELELTPEVDFSLGSDPLLPQREYTAMSKPAGVETRYRVELYSGELLTEKAALKVDTNPANRWLSETEILNEAAADGKPISSQVKMVFQLFRVFEHSH